MRKKLAFLLIFVIIFSMSWQSALKITWADNDKKTGEFELVSEEIISGYAGEPGVGGGGGESVEYIDIQIEQNGTTLKTIKVEDFEKEYLSGKKHYNFSVNMSSNWPTNLDRNQSFKLIGDVYRKVGKDIQHQYSFNKDNIKIAGEHTPTTASLDFEVKPSQASGYLIDPETEVAVVDINAKIIPKGVAGDGTRQTPIDVVFVFDTSGSMVLNMKNRSSDKDKFNKAKEAAKSAIDKFRESAIVGDRFAFVPFEIDVGSVTKFNNNTTESGIKTHLNSIKSSIDTLKADGGTNYYAALSKANELFGSSSKPKYVIFLTDGRPDTYENYSSTKISGEFPKMEKTTKEVKVKECFLIWCEWKTKTQTEEKWSSKKYPVNGANVPLSRNKNNGEITFNYNGNKYLFGKGDMDYAYARVAASNLATKGAKLYSVGFGSDGDVDMDFLNELSNLTGAFAVKGEKSNIISIFESITNTIIKQSIRDIKVKVNIKDPSFPGNVSLNGGAVIDETNPNYAVLNFDDIQYEDDKTPSPPGAKSFSLNIDEPGIYTFSDAKLIYTDISNETKTVEGAPFTVTVLNNKNVGMKFNADKYEIDVDSDPAPTIDFTTEVVPETEGGELPADITWTSSNSNVATINKGILTPIGVGDAQIKITAVDEEGNPIQATTMIKVNVVIEGIKFDAQSYSYDGPMDMLPKVKFIQSANANFKLPDPRNALQWGPADSDIVKIENGNVTRKGEASGFQIITVKLKEPHPTNDYYKIKPSAKTEASALIKVNGTSKIIEQPKAQW
ncbi:vWA domain-containing protein [Schinkia azotoformans]|uniref:vWA domain-containing protein n=1 Tax=Schinkia azotoformans TaxID=1454 RepID=UPI002DBF6144|nr:vWA domain-containing protein [Schinkia azotoformans]MEC1759128.1 VWA domain-containing protein [Schinkia azotoformans]